MSETHDDGVTAFAAMFATVPGTNDAEARKSREARKMAERRTQQTPAQRKRKAVRTEILNTRCSAEFKTDLKDAAERADCSMADILEEALALWLKAEKKR